MINARANNKIETKNICLGLLYFSPKTAAGPIAIKPSIIAGTYAFHKSVSLQLNA